MIFVVSTPEHNMFYWISPEMHDELLELGDCWGEGIVNLRSSSNSEIVYFPNTESMTLSPLPALVGICFLSHSLKSAIIIIWVSHSQGIPRNLAIIGTAELPSDYIQKLIKT